MTLLLAIFITSLATPIAANHPASIFLAQQVNSISGNVTDERRNPIPDLQVELLDDVNSVIQRTKTDSSGQLKRYNEAADELELFLKIQPDSKDTELIKKLIQRFREKSREDVKQ